MTTATTSCGGYTDISRTADGRGERERERGSSIDGYTLRILDWTTKACHPKKCRT